MGKEGRIKMSTKLNGDCNDCRLLSIDVLAVKIVLATGERRGSKD